VPSYFDTPKFVPIQTLPIGSTAMALIFMLHNWADVEAVVIFNQLCAFVTIENNMVKRKRRDFIMCIYK
jgi:hypothetical protein